MQPGKMHPDWMQWIPCSMIECSGFHAAWRNGTLWNAADFMLHDWMQWIPCSMIECSGFHATWRNWTLWNAVDSMQCDWMQWIPAAWLNAVYFLQLGPKHPDLMQWIFCSMSQNIQIECSQYRSAWLNAVDFMQHGQKHPDGMQWIPCIVIECSELHAAL